MIDIKNGDCLELMPHIPPQSVDMILCDLPYSEVCKDCTEKIANIIDTLKEDKND